LGDKINNLFGNSANQKNSDTKGLLMSVHPLGGCAMGDSVETGVVNVHGQVFKPNDLSGSVTEPNLEVSEGASSGPNEPDASTTNEVYDNLAVIDGAIVPFPADVNPALTISVH